MSHVSLVPHSPSSGQVWLSSMTTTPVRIALAPLHHTVTTPAPPHLQRPSIPNRHITIAHNPLHLYYTRETSITSPYARSSVTSSQCSSSSPAEHTVRLPRLRLRLSRALPYRIHARAYILELRATVAFPVAKRWLPQYLTTDNTDTNQPHSLHKPPRRSRRPNSPMSKLRQHVRTRI
jgi:hypothetical protein